MRASLAPLLLFVTVACGSADPSEPGSPGPSAEPPGEQPVVPEDPDANAPADPDAATYWADAKPVLNLHCEGCHTAGGIAPFALDTFEEALAWKDTLPGAIESGAMPPWPPASDCADLVGERTLPTPEAEALLAWVADGGVEGDPADWDAPEPEASMAVDFSLQMAEAYVPSDEGADDHRCFVLQWPEDDPTFLTGYSLEPGRRDLVHHMIAYAVEPGAVDAALRLDEEDAGAGYSCTSGIFPGDAASQTAGQYQMVGGWVPGVQDSPLPTGTGIEIAPGSAIVLQFHYNTQYADPADGGDQSTLHVRVDDQVQLPSKSLFIVDLLWLLDGGMPIPAGDSDVRHDTEFSGWALNLSALDVVGFGQPMLLHTVSLHMHQLGAAGGLSILRDGDRDQEECLLQIDDWDFGWQGGYGLVSPAIVGVDDDLYLHCRWDNSAGNQPWVDGAQQTPLDVQWGDGSLDEMCLGAVLVSGLP